MRRYGSEANERWIGFEHRPDDIVISTRSKCGTTLTQMLCALLVFQEPELPAPLASISPWLDWDVEPIEVVRRRLASQGHRRIIKTHTPLDGLPLDPRVTYLVVGRHPLDVALSLHHHGRNIDRAREAALRGVAPTPHRERPVQGWIRAWMDADAPVEAQLDTLRGLVHHLTDAWQRREAPNVVLLHHRDLAGDTEAQLRALADRLHVDVPASRLPELARAASFEAMKARAAWLAPDRLGVLKDATSFFRSGRSGEGERVLGDDDRARYERRVAELAPPELIDWLHHGSPRTS